MENHGEICENLEESLEDFRGEAMGLMDVEDGGKMGGLPEKI